MSGESSATGSTPLFGPGEHPDAISFDDMMPAEDDADILHEEPTSEDKLFVEPESLHFLRHQSIEEQESGDTSVKRGMVLFFCNQFEEAEAIFYPHRNTEPLHALSFAACAFVKALMSFSSQDFSRALGRCQHGERLANAVLKMSPPSVKLIRGSKSLATKMLEGVIGSRHHAYGVYNYQLRATVVKAECALLASILYMLQESSAALLQGGLALRRSYNSYMWAVKHLHDLPSTCKQTNRAASLDLHAIYQNSLCMLEGVIECKAIHMEHLLEGRRDENTVSGLVFGYGALCAVLAGLPSKLMAILKFCGFPCDNSKGLPLVYACWQHGGLRQPLAGLFLQLILGILPGVAAIMAPGTIRAAESILGVELNLFHGSAVHHWLRGRLLRLRRNLDGASGAFDQVAQLGSSLELKAVRDLALYDMAWTHVAKGHLVQAAGEFTVVALSNDWATVFGRYAATCCALYHSELRAIRILAGEDSEYASLFEVPLKGEDAETAVHEIYRKWANDVRFQSTESQGESADQSEEPPVSMLLPLNGISSIPVRRFGGRILSPEQLALRRCRHLSTHAFGIMELAYFFAMFPQFSPQALAIWRLTYTSYRRAIPGAPRSVLPLEAPVTLEEMDDNPLHRVDHETICMLDLLDAVAAREILFSNHLAHLAAPHSDLVAAFKAIAETSKHFHRETWVRPHALYELAITKAFPIIYPNMLPPFAEDLSMASAYESPLVSAPVPGMDTPIPLSPAALQWIGAEGAAHDCSFSSRARLDASRAGVLGAPPKAPCESHAILEEAQHHLHEAKKPSKFSFDLQLSLRIQLTAKHIEAAMAD